MIKIALQSTFFASDWTKIDKVNGRENFQWITFNENKRANDRVIDNSFVSYIPDNVYQQSRMLVTLVKNIICFVTFMQITSYRLHKLLIYRYNVGSLANIF